MLVTGIREVWQGVTRCPVVMEPLRNGVRVCARRLRPAST